MSIGNAKIHLANANRNATRTDPTEEAAIAQAHALVEIYERISENTRLVTQLLADIRDRLTPDEPDTASEQATERPQPAEQQTLDTDRTQPDPHAHEETE